MDKMVMKTDITEYSLFSRGKVRDVYDLDDKLLIVTTDRVSAFDVILPNRCRCSGLIFSRM